jgi:uncharacterized protein
MIAILDTNVLVSGLITPHGVCGAILQALTDGVFEAYVTRDILLEYTEVPLRPKFKIDGDKRQKILSLFKHLETEPEMLRDAQLPDPDDVIFLVAAVASNADYLVTGNLRHFLEEMRFGVKVVSPAEFLGILQAGKL